MLNFRVCSLYSKALATTRRAAQEHSLRIVQTPGRPCLCMKQLAHLHEEAVVRDAWHAKGRGLFPHGNNLQATRPVLDLELSRACTIQEGVQVALYVLMLTHSTRGWGKKRGGAPRGRS